jgi:5-carboxymethyl-2-hydroxymuconate isomerase
MPHIVVEYSGNLRSTLDLQGLLDALATTAVGTGVFPIGGVRARAYAAEHYRIADGHPDNAFVHVLLKVGHGRDQATRQRACEAIFATLSQQLDALYARIPLGISLEMQEVDPVLTCKRNNLHEYVKQRAEGSHGR